MCQPSMEILCHCCRRAQWYLFVEMEGWTGKCGRGERLEFRRGATFHFILCIQLSDHDWWERHRNRDQDCPLTSLDGLSLLMVDERLTFNTSHLMDAAREVRVAAHPGSPLRSIGQVVENARLLLGMSIGVENGGDIAFERIGLAVGPSQTMFVFAQIPGQGSQRIGVPQQPANIRGSHAHFAHPGGGGGACAMGGNTAHHIGLTDSCNLAEQWDRAAVEKFLYHELIAVLEQILRRLVCFAIR